MTSGAGRSLRRVGVVVCVPVALIAGAVFLTANVQRSAVVRAAQQQETSESMLNAILNQQSAARGFFESHEPASLQPWNQGIRVEPGGTSVAGGRELGSGTKSRRSGQASDRLACRDTGRDPHPSAHRPLAFARRDPAGQTADA